MVRLPLPSAERMKFRTLADLGQSALGPMRLVRVESGRYNGRLFALQRVDPSVAAIPQLTSAILDDAFITAVVFSRNVVQFIAWGHDDEGTYIAIELVQGASLRHLLKAAAAHKESIPDRVIGFLCSELCAGLHALHSVRGPDGDLMGLAHGRLSPSNVLLSFKGEVKIADVGLASAKERVQKAKPGGVEAEVGYLAPEQTDGRAPDTKADLFSFGVLLFELLAGRPPWIASSPEETQRLVATEPPPDLAALRKWCDPFFLELVRACLEKDPEKRLGSAGKIVELLAEWHASRGFGDGDQEALAKLVQRLGSHQKEWYRRALGGELVRPDSTDLHTALDRVDFGVDPETRRAGGTASPVLVAPHPPVPPPPLAPPPPAPQDAAGSRAAAAPPTAPQGRASMRPAPPLADAKLEKRPRPRAPEARPSEARPPEGRPSSPEARPPEGRPSSPEARPPEGRPSSPEARPPEGRPSSPEARPPEGRPSDVPEPRPSVPAGPPVPSARPASLVPEPRPSSPAAESWFPAMWPSGRGGEEGRPSAPPSNLSPSARFAFVSRWAASAENAGKDEPGPYRNDRPSQPAVPAASKPGAWVTAAQASGKAAALPPSVPEGGLAPPRLPSIPPEEQSVEPLDAPEVAGEASPGSEPPSSRPEPLTLRTGAHALVQRLEKIEKKPG